MCCVGYGSGLSCLSAALMSPPWQMEVLGAVPMLRQTLLLQHSECTGPPVPGSLVQVSPHCSTLRLLQKNQLPLLFSLWVLTQHKVSTSRVQRGKFQGKCRINKLEDKDLSFLPALLVWLLWLLQNYMRMGARDERAVCGAGRESPLSLWLLALGLRGLVCSLGE